MKIKVLPVLLTASALFSGCGRVSDNIFTPPEEISQYSRPASGYHGGGNLEVFDGDTQKLTAAEPSSIPPSDKPDSYFEYDSDMSDGESAGEITMHKKNIKSDERGFLIEDNILYDYTGDSSLVYIPDGVKRIESQAFWGNDTVKALIIPGSVVEIGNAAFWSCSGLEYVKAEEGLKRIHSAAFWSCSGLTVVELPESVQEISDDVFWAISDITIHAPEGSYAQEFALNTGKNYSPDKTELVLSTDKVINAGEYRYSEFESFTIPDDAAGIDAEAFQYCKKLRSIIIPANVKYIGSNAFEYCYELRNVNIVSCAEIRAEAFEYCEKLSSVKIGEGCEKIGSSAFGYCTSLSDVYLPQTVESINSRAFSNCSPDLILHVPAGSYAETFAQENDIPYDYNYR